MAEDVGNTTQYSNSVLNGLDSLANIFGKVTDSLGSYKERASAIELQKQDAITQTEYPSGIDVGSVYENVKTYGITIAMFSALAFGVYYIIKKL